MLQIYNGNSNILAEGGLVPTENILQTTSDPTLQAFEVHILGATPTIEPYRMHKTRSKSEASSRDRKPEYRFFDISKTETVA